MVGGQCTHRSKILQDGRNAQKMLKNLTKKIGRRDSVNSAGRRDSENNFGRPAGFGKLFRAKKRSGSQMKDQVMTMKTHTESSKSELSSRGKRLFKVSFKKTNERTNERTDVQPYRTNHRIGRRQKKLLRNFFGGHFFCWRVDSSETDVKLDFSWCRTRF